MALSMRQPHNILVFAIPALCHANNAVANIYLFAFYQQGHRHNACMPIYSFLVFNVAPIPSS